MSTLASIAEIRMGATLRGRDATRAVPDGQYRFLRIGDISSDGGCDLSDLLRIEPNEPINASFVLRQGDVLFPNRGTRTVAFAFPGCDEPTIVGGQFFIVRPVKTKLLPEYLAWFLRTDAAHRHFESRRKGSYVQLVQRKDLEELEIALPSLATQRKIVEVDALAQQEKALSEQLAALRWRFQNEQLLLAARKGENT